MDGRPRKGQERSAGSPDIFALEVAGGNLNSKPQSAGEADAEMGAPIHVSHRGMEHVRSKAVDAAGGLSNGQPRKGHVGGMSADDSTLRSDGLPGKGAQQGDFKAADWMLTRVGSIRIRAPGPGEDKVRYASPDIIIRCCGCQAPAIASLWAQFVTFYSHNACSAYHTPLCQLKNCVTCSALFSSPLIAAGLSAEARICASGQSEQRGCKRRAGWSTHPKRFS